MEDPRSKSISGPMKIGNKGETTHLTYGTLTFRDDGVLNLYGNVNLSVQKILNEKPDDSPCSYEIKVFGDDGENGKNSVNGEKAQDGEDGIPTKVMIQIGKLESSITVVGIGGNGGDGGNGLNGADGGSGADAANTTGQSPSLMGGSGGNGSNGSGKGGNGGDGGVGPTVEIFCKDRAEGTTIEKILECSKGGRPGKGGLGGKGGSGGINGDGITRAPKGDDGCSFDDGLPGKDGKVGEIEEISAELVAKEMQRKRKRFQEKLENHNGLYRLNLAIDEENEYYLESIGGEDYLKNNCPTLHTSYLKARETAMKRSAEGVCMAAEKEHVHFSAYEIMTVNNVAGSQEGSNTAGTHLAASLCGSFIDNTTDLASKAPAKAFNVSVHGKIYDPNSSRLAYLDVHESYQQINQMDQQFKSDEAYETEDFWNRDLKLRFTISVYDEANDLLPYAYSSTKKFGNPTDYVIEKIKIEKPVSGHRQNNEIRILYGRTAENLADPDYIYLSNNSDVNKGILWTIVPIAGSVTLKGILTGDNYYSFEKLTKPFEGEHLGRSTLQYAGKDWKTYRSDLRDDPLYELLTKNNFNVKVGDNKVETLNFDLFNPDYTAGKDRRYDWVDDIDRGNMDGRDRVCYLIGGFEYDICKKNKEGKIIEASTSYQIEFHSIDPQRLPAGRTYYTSVPGSGVVYIPPLRLWWGCYSRNTQITLADGSSKLADQIKAGDLLPCYGGKKLTVNNIFAGHEKNLVSIKTENGASISVSTGHPMLAENGMGVPAENLEIGDTILMANGSPTKIVDIDFPEYNDTVYNFSFEGEDEGNYLVADGFFSGDFYAQNMLNPAKPLPTQEQQALFNELRALTQHLKG